MSTTFESIFAEFPVFTLQENGKLLCTVTNHELPHRIETLREYVASKKFQRAMKIEQFMNANGQYFDDLGALYGCKLTMTLIAKDPEDLQRHIAGKKFKRALEKAKAKQAAAIANGDASDAPGAMEGMDDDHESGGDLLESGDEDSDEAISSDDDYEQEYGTRSARGARARHAEEEYPEFARNNDALGETAEDDSYDFAVMDTEMDTAVTANGAVKARKRKGENGNAGAQKKRLR